MYEDEMQLLYGVPKMSRVPEKVQIPFTRRHVNPWRHMPFQGPRYKSMFELTAESGKMMADKATDELLSSGAARTHSGQTVSGIIASGLSASALRVPEIQTGSLVAVSL